MLKEKRTNRKDHKIKPTFLFIRSRLFGLYPDERDCKESITSTVIINVLLHQWKGLKDAFSNLRNHFKWECNEKENVVVPIRSNSSRTQLWCHKRTQIYNPSQRLTWLAVYLNSLSGIPSIKLKSIVLQECTMNFLPPSSSISLTVILKLWTNTPLNTFSGKNQVLVYTSEHLLFFTQRKVKNHKRYRSKQMFRSQHCICCHENDGGLEVQRMLTAQ